MRHGSILIGQCEACGLSETSVQLYTDSIIKDGIYLCLDSKAIECLNRQESEFEEN
jgi:hypothetical protein